MSIDAIGDFLTIIRNGLMSSKLFVVAPYSKLKMEIASILKDEGFIRDSAVFEEDGKQYIKIFLKYIKGESVIHELKRVSTPEEVIKVLRILSQLLAVWVFLF